MITVCYSCPSCGVQNQNCEVPARDRGEDEDVVIWMHRVIQIIAADHRSMFPNCTASELKDLKIPLKSKDGTEAEFIGQQID